MSVGGKKDEAPKLSQALVMTPQLQMAIRLLQLTRKELFDEMQRQVEAHPGLVATSARGEFPLKYFFPSAKRAID